MSRIRNIEKVGVAASLAAIAAASGFLIANSGNSHKPGSKTTTESQPFDEGKALLGAHVIKSMEQDFPENTPIYDTPDPKTQKVVGYVQPGGKMEVQGGLSFVVKGKEFTAFAQDPSKVHDLASLEEQEVYVSTDAATFSGSPAGFKPTTVMVSPNGELSLNVIDGQPVNRASTVTAGPNPKHTR